MLVMGVRNIRKYAPHAVQKEVTRKVADMLRQENLYRPAEDDACLSRREGKLLKAWMGGKSGLDFSYYWKKMRKAGAGCCAADITRMNNPMKKNEFAVVLASDNRGIPAFERYCLFFAEYCRCRDFLQNLRSFRRH